MQASSQTPKANKPQAPTHPHTTNTLTPNITLSQCQHAKTDNLGYTNCIRGNGHVGICIFPCPYGQHNDRWEWDKQNIQRYRETREPHDDYERFMLEKAQSNPYWVKMWASQGCIEKRVLPSGLTVLIKRGEGKFEEFVLTDTGEVLDFNHEPKDYHIHLNKPIKITPELLTQAKAKLTESRHTKTQQNQTTFKLVTRDGGCFTVF